MATFLLVLCAIVLLVVVLIAFAIRSARKQAREHPLNKFGPVWEAQLPTAAIRFCFSPDGGLLVGLAHDGSCTAWNTRDWSRIFEGRIGGAPGRLYLLRDAIAFSATGGQVLFATEGGQLQRYALPDFAPISEGSLIHDPMDVKWPLGSSDPRDIVALTRSNDCCFVEYPFAKRDPVQIDCTGGWFGCLSADGQYALLRETLGSVVRCCDSMTGKVRSEWHAPENRQVNGKCISCQDGPTAVAMYDEKFAFLAVPALTPFNDIGNSHLSSYRSALSSRSHLHGVHVIDRAKGQYVIVTNSHAVLYLQNEPTFVLKLQTDPGRLPGQAGFAYSAARSLLAVAAEDGSGMSMVFDLGRLWQAPSECWERNAEYTLPLQERPRAARAA